MRRVSEHLEDCQKCLDGTHPFKCFIHEHGGMSAFDIEGASIEQLVAMIVGTKLCNKCAEALEEIRQRREIQMAVA